MHILIAPNAFKNSLSAADAALAIQKGLEQSGLSHSSECFPIGDGGDGTADLIIQHRKGSRIPVRVQDPLGRSIQSSFGLIDQDRTAVIEMADASGLRLLQENEKDPLRASSYGTGELIKHALDHGVQEIIIGVGGSATVDGGMGMLQALGIRFFDQKGRELDDHPSELLHLTDMDLSGLDPRLGSTKITVLCDVENPLLGEKGAATVFGPQKGASPASVMLLETGLKKLRDLTLIKTGQDMSLITHGGAAGGIAAAMFVFLNARLVPGITQFLALTGFEAALARADLLITGEGSIDEQTLDGKGPFGVAQISKAAHIPVIGLAGQVPLEKSEALDTYFDALIPISQSGEPLSVLLTQTAVNLTKTAASIGQLLSHSSLHDLRKLKLDRIIR